MEEKLYTCDGCARKVPSRYMPYGWVEVSFYNKSWFRHHLCSYRCLTVWSADRHEYYKNRDIKEEMLNEIPMEPKTEEAPSQAN